MASNLYEILTDVWDTTNHALKMVINMIHTHASDEEGGQLDWDSVWSDAVHGHSSNAEGGTIAHSALTGLTSGDDHTQYLKESEYTAAGDLIQGSGAGTVDHLHISTNGKYLRSNGTLAAWSDSDVVYTLALYGGTSRNTNATERTTNELAFTKLKEMKASTPAATVVTLTVGWTMDNSGSGVVTVHSKVYKNGVAVGVDKTSTSAEGEVITDTITMSLAADDLVQIYGYTENGAVPVAIWNAYIGYDYYITKISDMTLTTRLKCTDDPTFTFTNQDP